MSLLDDLKTVRAKRPSLPAWLISRTPDERKAFEQALDDPTVSTDALCLVVRAHGGSVSRKTIEAMRYSRVTR